MAKIDTSKEAVARIAASLPSAVWTEDFGPQEVVLALLAERDALQARVAELEVAATRYITALDTEKATKSYARTMPIAIHNRAAALDQLRAALSREGGE